MLNTIKQTNRLNRISLGLSQSKDYKIGIHCFSAEHTTLRSKSKDWFAQNQDNMSEWSDIYTCRLLLAHLVKGKVSFCHHFVFVVCRKHLWKILSKACSFCPDPLTNMAAIVNSCFWLADLKKIFSFETTWPNEPKLGRKPHWKFLYKECSFSSGQFTNMAATDNSCFWLADL